MNIQSGEDQFQHLIISRKRKHYKFAHFDNYENTHEHIRGTDAVALQKELAGFFKSGDRVIVEIAAGNAQFSLELARRNPKNVYLAIDIKSDRLYSSAKQALEEGVENIRFLRMSLDQVETVLPASSIDELWLTFPDPFPKKKNQRKRLTYKTFLQQYRKIIKDTGVLHFKTDARALFLWSLEQLVADHWTFSELSFDLHESALSDEYKIQTQYEERFHKEGIPINYLTAYSATATQQS